MIVSSNSHWIARESGVCKTATPFAEVLCGECVNYSISPWGRKTIISTQPATSLGGVESLMEHRIQSDPSSDPRLIRISVGVEDVEVCWPHTFPYCFSVIMGFYRIWNRICAKVCRMWHRWSNNPAFSCSFVNVTSTLDPIQIIVYVYFFS